MSKIYKIHKWLSIVSVLFFLMFSITGLILMFRTELNAWAGLKEGHIIPRHQWR